MPDNLRKLREQIMQVSQEILELLNKRHVIAMAIGEEKSRLAIPPRDPVREAILLQSLVKGNTGAYPPEAIEIIFQTIFDISVATQAAKRDNAS